MTNFLLFLIVFLNFLIWLNQILFLKLFKVVDDEEENDIYDR